MLAPASGDPRTGRTRLGLAPGTLPRRGRDGDRVAIDHAERTIPEPPARGAGSRGLDFPDLASRRTDGRAIEGMPNSVAASAAHTRNGPGRGHYGRTRDRRPKNSPNRCRTIAGSKQPTWEPGREIVDPTIMDSPPPTQAALERPGPPTAWKLWIMLQTIQMHGLHRAPSRGVESLRSRSRRPGRVLPRR